MENNYWIRLKSSDPRKAAVVASFKRQVPGTARCTDVREDKNNDDTWSATCLAYAGGNYRNLGIYKISGGKLDLLLAAEGRA